MEYGRFDGNLVKFKKDIFLLAPIPIVYKKFKNVTKLNKELIKIAKSNYVENVLEVPDERHINKLGNPITFKDEVWRETQIPAIGVWHRVPTNNFLNIEHDAVKKIRTMFEIEFYTILKSMFELRNIQAVITESWIQFYKNGDYKVLHNHERYGPPYPNNRWVGSYYLDDGNPDKHMPYSGVFSFRVRDSNYFIKPHSGLLLLFPADILHEVHPFYGTGNRIVINFNINGEPK